ncbi:Lysophospholipase 1 [Xylographa opegraphella]|nr:Lysophospholipase 1 [Xylographa opegraphella]
MKLDFHVAATVVFSVACQASLILPRQASSAGDAGAILGALEARALPNAPNGYTPQGGNCPSTRPELRSADGLSPQETSWLETRRSVTLPAMKQLLNRLNISGFDASTYFSDNMGNTSMLPNIAVAVSGGGYRACLNGAGAIQAFDSREDNSTAAGHLGGLLQSATYLAGLSGGGWLVGSIFVNNYTTISGLLYNNNASSVWEFQNSIFQGPATGGLQVLDSTEYYDTIYNEVQGKTVHFDTSITDYWGRALSFQLVNATDGGPGYTWSSTASQDFFTSGQSPMPILVTDGRAPGELLISGNTTVYEFNPWEFGTFDPTTYGFVPLEFLGSNFSGGVLPPNDQCVRGFDNVGYIMGTSSSLFNSFLLEINSTSIPSAFKTVLTHLLTSIGENNDDIAAYTPNPFLGFHNTTSLVAQSPSLTLVDGGEDLQNIPLHPLIQPARAVDVIFAIDSSADTTYNWPNGTALVATYERALNASGIANGTAFPSIPDQNSFVNLGLNARPTFFGCNASNFTSGGPPPPLVVYVPNAPYVYYSNVSTFDPSYNASERDAIVANGAAVASRANATTDPAWPACVACAVLARSWERTSFPVPSACADCFRTYCWDGELNITRPAEYEPTLRLEAVDVQSAAGRGRGHGVWAALGTLVVGWVGWGVV